MKARISGVTRPITAAKLKFDGVGRFVTRVARHDGTGLIVVYPFAAPPVATASPVSVLGFREDVGLVTTEQTTVTPSGGTAPYTYAWARLSGFGAADTPTTAFTTFSETQPLDEFRTGVFRCTVTDSIGATATVDVTAEFLTLPGSDT